jgi:hypothetical protein
MLCLFHLNVFFSFSLASTHVIWARISGPGPYDASIRPRLSLLIWDCTSPSGLKQSKIFISISNFQFFISIFIFDYIAKRLSSPLAIRRRHFFRIPTQSLVIAISDVCSCESKTEIITWPTIILRSQFAFLSFALNLKFATRKYTTIYLFFKSSGTRSFNKL